MTGTHTDFVIIGAGLAGLAAAITLRSAGASCEVIESETRPGGLARSFRKEGFTFDCSGHLLHLAHPTAIEFIGQRTTQIDWAMVNRVSEVLIGGSFVPYPFQMHLAFAPTEVRRECVESLPDAVSQPHEYSNLLDWMHSELGGGITKWFMEPYNAKLLTVSPRELALDALGRFLPRPSLEEIRVGASSKRKIQTGYNSAFRYPASGGIDQLVDSFAEDAGALSLGEAVTAISIAEKLVTTSKREIRYEKAMLSTMPLTNLAKLAFPSDRRERLLGSKLRHNSVTCVNVGFRPAMELSDGLQWIYLPGEEYAAYRIGFYDALCPAAVPNREFKSAYIEISYPPGSKPGRIEDLAIGDLRRLGILDSFEDVAVTHSFDIPVAYIIKDLDTSDSREEILQSLRTEDVYSFGRYGSWEYSAMEDAIVQGVEAAQKCLEEYQ